MAEPKKNKTNGRGTKAIVMALFAMALVLLPIYPCTVNEHEGGSYPLFEKEKDYFTFLPAVMVCAYNFTWTMQTPTCDWGIDWKYEGHPAFLVLLICIGAAFGFWLYTAGDLGTIRKRKGYAVISGACFALGGAFYLTALYLVDLQIKWAASDLGYFKLERYFQAEGARYYQIVPLIIITYIVCVPTIIAGFGFLARDHPGVAKGEKQLSPDRQ